MAFKLKVSSPTYHFQVDNGEGFIKPNGVKKVEIKISHKGVASARDIDPREVSRAKFQIEVADATAFKVNKNSDNTKDFWKKEQGKGIKTILTCQLVESMGAERGESVDAESKEEPVSEIAKPEAGDTAKTTHYDLSELVSIVPTDIIRFSSSQSEGSDRTVTIKNTSDSFIAYKMKVSVHQIFFIQNAEGFVTPKSTAEINVMMRELSEIPDPLLSLSNAKLAVEVDTVSISDMTMSPKEFWKTRGNQNDGKHTSTRFVVKCVNENVEEIDAAGERSGIGSNKDNSNVDDGVSEGSSKASVSIQMESISPFSSDASSPIKIAEEHRVLHSAEKPPPSSPNVGIIGLVRSSSLEGPLSPVEEESTANISPSTSSSKEGTTKKVSFEGLGRHRDSMEMLTRFDNMEGADQDQDISSIDVSNMVVSTSDDNAGVHSNLKLKSQFQKSVHFQEDKKKSVHFDESIEKSLESIDKTMSSSLQIKVEGCDDEAPAPVRAFSEDSTFNPTSPNFRPSAAVPTLVTTPLGIGSVASAQAARQAATISTEEDKEVEEGHTFPPTPPSPRVRSPPSEVPKSQTDPQPPPESEQITEAFSVTLSANVVEPTDRLLDLLVKNVGTEEPLSSSEIHELMTTRKKLSKMEWQDWLEIGRAEKERRNLVKEAKNVESLLKSPTIHHSDVADEISSYEYSPYPEQRPPIKQASPVPIVQPIVPQGEPLTTFATTNSSGYLIDYKRFKEENTRYISPGKLSPRQSAEVTSPLLTENSPTPGQRFSMLSNFSKAMSLKDNRTCKEGELLATDFSTVNGEVHNTILLNQQRIDGACAAAKTLLDAIESEDPQFTAANPGSRLNESKKSILSEMINALDRSKNELGDIASIANTTGSVTDFSNADIERQVRREDGHLQVTSLAPLYRIGNTPVKYKNGLSSSSLSSSQYMPSGAGGVDTSTSFYPSSPMPPTQHPHANNLGEKSPALPSPSIRNSHILSESMNSGFSTSYDNVSLHAVDMYISRDDFSVAKHRDLMERSSVNINYRGDYGYSGTRLSKDTVIERLCVSERPVFKSDTFPIRVDVESAGIDLIWREPREGAPNSKRDRSILRRERFQFDDVFAGLGAAAKLFSTMRKRVKRALTLNRSMVFLGLSCGETIEQCKSLLEPPLAMVFGDRGGGGVLSVTIDELFHTLRPPPSSQMKSVPTSAVHAPYVNVTMTAVVLGGSRTIDLLGDFSTERKSANRECRFVKRPDGKTVLVNATTVHLEQPSDLERIIGVLLGKKGCRKEMMNVLRNVHEVSQVDDTFGTSQLLDPLEATMLISVHVSPITVGRLNPTDFQFVCPYGDSWSTASRDICIFAESLASFPHPPPPSVQNNSLLSRILLDRPASQPSDFLCVANVSKSSKDTTTVVSKAVPKFCSSINANSFRSLRQIPTVDVENHDGGSELIEKALQVLRIVSHMPNNY